MQKSLIPKTPKPKKRSAVVRLCEICGEAFWARTDKIKAGDGRCCSRACMLKLPRQVDKSGENNPNWQGGISRDNYRYTRRQRERHPERVRAREAVKRAVEAGQLVRGPCADCGASAFTEGHHEDYARPLDVVWLCETCHRARHGGRY
jgi:hypothetical protein